MSCGSQVKVSTILMFVKFWTCYATAYIFCAVGMYHCFVIVVLIIVSGYKFVDLGMVTFLLGVGICWMVEIIVNHLQIVPCHPKESSVLDWMSRLARQDCFVCSFQNRFMGFYAHWSWSKLDYDWFMHIPLTVVTLVICIISTAEAIVPVVVMFEWIGCITTWYSKAQALP